MADQLHHIRTDILCLVFVIFGKARKTAIINWGNVRDLQWVFHLLSGSLFQSCEVSKSFGSRLNNGKTMQVGAEALKKTISASKQLNTEGELLATVDYHQVCREKT